MRPHLTLVLNVYCVAVCLDLLVHVWFCCIKFSFFQFHAKGLAGKNISEMTYFYVEWDVKS